MYELNILDFGATADGRLVTKEIQAAIDQATQQGGGRVVIPTGTFYTSALFLKDNVELHLTPGAILKFSDNQEDYPVVVSRWEGVKQEVYASCLYAENARNIAVTGLGLLDGNGQNWWTLFRQNRQDLKYPRPKLVSFDSCYHVTLKDFSIIDAPSWTINPILCENVTIDNLNILNPADSPNTDGIDPESCKNVRISNCSIDVGDDCIAIKAGTEQTAERVACENITITNCTMVHGHGAVVLGSEMSGSIRNVTISNCVFQDTDRGIRMKSRRGRGGTVENIRVDNIVMERILCPFTMNLYYNIGPNGQDEYVYSKAPYPIDDRTPTFRRIHFSNITARDITASAGFIYGLAENFVEEVTFDNVTIELAKEATYGHPDMMANLEPVAQEGFYIGNARDLTFDRVTIRGQKGPAFKLENTQDIEITRTKAVDSLDDSPLIEELFD
jgi:polygalacturonase